MMNDTMDHGGHSAHAMMNMQCDGTSAGSKRGTYKGHVGPGILFIIWGAWWTYSVFSYLLWRGKRQHRRQSQFLSKSWYPMPFRWIRFTEPILKIILPILYVSVELYFDHPDGFQYLRCPKGTLYAGRFALSHMNNWQHASTYPPVVLSGLVDVLSAHVLLPQGTGHVFLAFAFAVQAFVMGTHEKHLPQDKMVHWLLFVSMLLCFVAIVLELHAPRNPLPALGRGASAIFQGAWLCAIGKIEFENLPQWSEEYSGGAMIAPIYFVSVAVLVLSAVTLLGLFMAAVDYFNCVPLVLLPPEHKYPFFGNSAALGLVRDDSRSVGGYLELSRRDTAHAGQQQDGEMTKLLPLSTKRNTAIPIITTTRNPAVAEHRRLSNDFETFETDSARHTASSSFSSGAESPRSGGNDDDFAFPPHHHHNPQDLV